jgi:ketosteroid isomerase-like protein
MPKASYKTAIEASFERVSQLLHEKVEKPRIYVGAVRNSAIVERGDGYVIREMFQPHPKPLTIREKIYSREITQGEEHVFEHLNNPNYSGTFKNILTRLGGDDGKVELEYVMDWIPHSGVADPISDQLAATMVEKGVKAMKHIAENPVSVPDFVRDFFAAVDSLDAENMRGVLADDVVFRKGNDGEIIGIENVVAASRGITSRLRKMRHNFVAVYRDTAKTLVETFVEYELPSGQQYILPFMTAFEQSGGKISRVQVFGDMSTLIHGWPEPPKPVAAAA